MKLAVFTAVVGRETDPLHPVQPAYGVRYLCFTDQPIAPAGWETRPALRGERDATLKARELKILAHETLLDVRPDVSLWMDAAYELKVDPRPIAEEFLWRTDIAAFPHPDRDTVEEEGTALIRLGKVKRPLIEQQLKVFHNMIARPKHPLTSTGFLFRRHCPRVDRFNRLWWDLFLLGGHPRDQMTVDWAVVKADVDISHLPGHYRDNPYAKWHKLPTRRR